MSRFLDEAGLQAYHTKLEERLGSKLNVYQSDSSGSNEMSLDFSYHGLYLSSNTLQASAILHPNYVYISEGGDEYQTTYKPQCISRSDNYGTNEYTITFPCKSGTFAVGTMKSSSVSINSASSTSNRYYPVEINVDGTPFVNVPWTNTDTKVSYTSTTTSGSYPLLFKYSTGSTTTAAGTRFNTSITANPSTGTITATAFSGSGASLTSLNANNVTTGTLAISRGGTGQTSRASAQSTLSYLGDNPITSTTNDTTTNWGALGHGVAFYSTAGYLTDQAQQYGLILNVPKQQSSEIFQLWHDQPSGNLRHRGGNASNWSGSWRTCLDSFNYTDYVTRSAIGLSNTKFYLYYFNGTFTGTTGWFEGCVLSTWDGDVPTTNGGLWNVLKSTCFPIHFSGERGGKKLLRIWTTSSASNNYFDVIDTNFTISTQSLTVSNTGMTFNTVVKQPLLFKPA